MPTGQPAGGPSAARRWAERLELWRSGRRARRLQRLEDRAEGRRRADDEAQRRWELRHARRESEETLRRLRRQPIDVLGDGSGPSGWNVLGSTYTVLNLLLLLAGLGVLLGVAVVVAERMGTDRVTVVLGIGTAVPFVGSVCVAVASSRHSRRVLQVVKQAAAASGQPPSASGTDETAVSAEQGGEEPDGDKAAP